MTQRSGQGPSRMAGSELWDELGIPADPVLASVVARLRGVEGPGSESDRRGRMLVAVRHTQDLDAARAPAAYPGVTGHSLWRAVRAQVEVVRLPLIAAAVLLLLVGVALGPLWLRPICTPLLALAPPIAVLGVGYAFRSLDGGMRELECACPVRPIELALSRLIVVVGCDTALSLLLPFNAGHALLGGVGAGLILDGLAPLLLASGASLLATQRFGSLVAVELGMLIWLGFVASHVLIGSGTISITETAGIAVWTGSTALGLGSFVVGVALFGRSALWGASR